MGKQPDGKQQRTVAEPAFPDRTKKLKDNVKTPIRLWLIPFVIVVFLCVLRVPRSVEIASQQATQKFADNNDPDIINLAVTVAAYLSLIIVAFVLILYFVIASALNKYLYPTGFLIWRNRPIGYFFIIATLSTVIPHILATLYKLLKPQELPFVWIYPFGITIFTMAVCYRLWKNVSWSKKMILIISSIVFAELPLIL